MAQLKDQLKADLVVAMKAHDDEAKSTLRMAIAAIMNAEVAETAHELTDAEELAIITREVHTREDSAKTYAEAGRQELADKETSEAELLKHYLPEPLGHDELQEIVDAEVAAASEDGKPTMKQMGRIVRAVNDQVKGRAEGREVAALVKKALTS
ncbi:GatB/YqeY domain-containing protein [Propionibacterium sp.]|uniref:GatB/YqeY domain-containing protein n=1 Tax=Propionibacterium sp. TaxID=1977903 RepID=UPI0039EB3FE2